MFEGFLDEILTLHAAHALALDAPLLSIVLGIRALHACHNPHRAVTCAQLDIARVALEAALTDPLIQSSFVGTFVTSQLVAFAANVAILDDSAVDPSVTSLVQVGTLRLQHTHDEVFSYQWCPCRPSALCVVQKSRSAFESCPRFPAYQSMKAALQHRIQREHQTASASDAVFAEEPVGDISQGITPTPAMPNHAAGQGQTTRAPDVDDGANSAASAVRPYHSLPACAISAMMLCRASSVVASRFPAGVGPALYDGFVMCGGTGVQNDGATPPTIGTLLIAAAGGNSRVTAGMSVGERGDVARLSAGSAPGSFTDTVRPTASVDLPCGPAMGGVAAPRGPMQFGGIRADALLRDASSSLALPSDPSLLPTVCNSPGDRASRLSAAEPADSDAAAGRLLGLLLQTADVCRGGFLPGATSSASPGT